MNYCKITESKQAMTMPNPITLKYSNPIEEKKALIAELDGWLEMVYTEPPQYNPETQYITQYWEEENGKAVQKWEVHDIEPVE